MWMEPWIQLFTGQLLLYKENADVFGKRRSGKLVRKLKKGSGVGNGWIENQRCGQRGQTSNSIGERVFNWLNTGRPGFGFKSHECHNQQSLKHTSFAVISACNAAGNGAENENCLLRYPPSWNSTFQVIFKRIFITTFANSKIPSPFSPSLSFVKNYA